MESDVSGHSPPKDEPRESKRARNFIARQACETCRSKKTRCDEDFPCGLCRSLGIECHYVERKPTKQEVSLSTIFNTLRRIESKIDGTNGPIKASRKDAAFSEPTNSLKTPSTNGPTPNRTNDLHSLSDQSWAEERAPISFSQHQVLLWPAIKNGLPDRVRSLGRELSADYPTVLESCRQPLDMRISPYPSDAGRSWLSDLPISLIKGLSDAYFAVFNAINPVIDRKFFYSETLGHVLRDGFGCSMESCLVLNLMALGCMAIKSYQEGEFTTTENPSHQSNIPAEAAQHYEFLKWHSVIDEKIPGLRFFNEGRTRVGFLMCENVVEACQFYMLSAIFYAQIIRPIDSWHMTNRASTALIMFWQNQDIQNDWRTDMYSRLFWSAIMFESVLQQELELPASGLLALEDRVPIPRFVACPYPDNAPMLPELDESYFHYHFLAQVAHRIILTRIRHTIFYSVPSGNFPLLALVDELQHQLEQWRTNLPLVLQFRDNDSIPESTSPAHAVAVGLLRARYRIAKFHLGRPFLYKALHYPKDLTDPDLKICSETLAYAMNWPIVRGENERMRSCMPVKFGLCSQFFGQLLLFHSFAHSADPRLRETLPAGFEGWCDFMLRFLGDCAVYSPTVKTDLELVGALYREWLYPARDLERRVDVGVLE